ncbi:MAG: T9SS sorting signal type C domain-containing protein [Flavobacterium sp.]
MKNSTLLKLYIVVLALFVAANLYAQAPTITNFTPTVVTQRTTVVITGTNFTGVTAANVKFGGIAATAITVNSATQITATVGNGASGSVTVTNGSGTGSRVGLTYIAPAATGTNAKVTRVITNFNGYWNSASPSTDPTLQPDTSHSMLGFEYMGTIYSTGSATATNVLTANSVAFQNGNYRALPINNLTGNVVTGATNPTLIALASKIDGSATTRVATAPAVVGLSVRDVLIDGIRGLDLGTGITNLPSTSVLLFNASNILSSGINDNIPDILVSQIATPSDNSFSIYAFVDENGNIVGNPVQISLAAVPAVGRYKSDFFTLPAQSLNTAVVNGSTVIGENTRDIRLVGYRLSEFGINDTNKANAKFFKVMPSGTSDPAFMAYNRDVFQIPSPIITAQPASQVACFGAGNSVTFTVSATGDELVYQWEKNGVDIPGATSSTLTLNNVTTADLGRYRVLITNSSGAALSNYAYLNTVISLQPQNTPACQGTPVTLETIANGADISYQWYSNTSNSNTGGTIIQGATANMYQPPVTTVGTVYYYAVISNSNQSCVETRTNAVSVVTSLSPVAGTASGTTTICPSTTTNITLSGQTGSIQWQQSSNGVDGWSSVIGGSGGTTATYTTPALTATRYYRAELSTGTQCPNVTTNIVEVAVQDHITWTGSINTDWHVAGNWTCDKIPTLVDDVLIPVTENNPVVMDSTKVALGKSLTIADGAMLTINPLNNIQILNAVTVAAGADFIISNRANLVQNSEGTNNQNSGNVTVYRDSSPLYRLDYTLWSTPVAGQNIFQFSPQTVANRFYTYDTAQDLYLEVPGLGANSTSTFNSGVAYLIRMPNGIATVPGYNSGATAVSYNGKFKGVPNNGDITMPAVHAGSRYMGVGNPYPSAMNIWDFIDENPAELETGTLYFWRKTNNNDNSSYASINKFGYAANSATGGDNSGDVFVDGDESNWVINPGQGFIVQIDTLATGIKFTNAMRRGVNNNQFFRQVQQDHNISRVWLEMTSQAGAYSQAIIGYSDTTTDGFDYGWDGVMLNDGPLALYTNAGGQNLSIQAKAGFDVNDIVPLNYRADIAGTYTLSVTNKDGVFLTGQQVYAHDKVANTLTNLTQQAYFFTTAAGTFDNRFDIVYTTNAALSTDTPVLAGNNVIIYKDGGNLHVNTGALTMNDVKVYDTRGRLVHSTNDVNAAETVIENLSAQQQVLLVQVGTSGGTVTKKIVF